MDERYDVVVIGGGAAGLSGALTLSRARRSVPVVDAGKPRNAPAGRVHNYLGREGTPPAELVVDVRGVIVAAAQGHRAGVMINAELTAEDARAAVAGQRSVAA